MADAYSRSHQIKLYVLVSMTGMLFGAELVASQVSKSFVLLADSYHTLYNLMSLLLLVVSFRTSRARTLKNTFGWARLEVLGILLSVLVLCSLYFALTLGAALHLIHASHDPIRPLYPLLVLFFGLFGLLANVVCFLLIGGFTHHQECYLNIEGSEIHLGYVVGDQNYRQSFCDSRQERENSATDCQELQKINSEGAPVKPPRKKGPFRGLFPSLLRDCFSCLLVVLSACAVHFLEEPLGGAIADYADPVLSLIGVVIQIAVTYPFLKETGLILLQTVPNSIDIEQLQIGIKKEFPEIQNVHELHVWKQTKSHVMATVHVIVSSHSVYARLSSKLQAFFHRQGIASVTVQPEFHNEFTGNMPDLLTDCILPCTANCAEPTCCRPTHQTNGVRQRHGHAHSKPAECHQHNIDQTQDHESDGAYEMTALELTSAQETEELGELLRDSFYERVKALPETKI